MKYLLTGDQKEVQKVLQENRIRVERGTIRFVPVLPEMNELEETGEDEDVIDDDTVVLVENTDGSNREAHVDAEDAEKTVTEGEEAVLDKKDILAEDTKEVQEAEDTKEPAIPQKRTKK